MIEENESGTNADLLKRAEKLLNELVRLTGTGFLVVFMMHFLYTDAVIDDPYLLSQLNGWPLYGMILGSILYFSHVHMMAYQLGGALARFDRINAPSKPKCLFRMHKNSLTWRYFDKGLYDFVLKYIHIPTSNLKSKWNKCGRLFVFIFVTCWHCIGNRLWAFFWVWSNFGILYLEMLGKLIIESKGYRRLSMTFGSGTMKRINRVVGSQLLIIHISLSMLFFSGSENILIHIIHETYFNNAIRSYFVLSLAVYSAYHVSDLIFQYEKSKQQSCNVRKTK
ncbi:protein-cysteine N-palmitoyltransferase HHAT-like [Sitodiplosis mosellana]|uniref:protein-cysteine N-palmitoyltransferase HHAT-like n=1 Tax=Sitodiplosis mosellana TaxID=263140 RepID=UPI0024450320|nr:protein-cysteine N-palmitoyltransferase HHAT-like [Sitodiplosis mosellana]